MKLFAARDMRVQVGHTMRLDRRLLAVAALGGLLLAGCSEAAVAQASVEQEINDRLTEQVGVAPERVDCPGDLEAEPSATMRCTLTAPDGVELGVTVTVTGVDGNEVRFDIEVDDELPS